MGRLKLTTYLVVVLAIVAGGIFVSAIDRQPECPVGHYDLREDADREYLVSYPVLGETVPVRDHAWIAINEDGSFAIGSLAGFSTLGPDPGNTTVEENELQVYEGELIVGHQRRVVSVVSYRDEATIKAETWGVGRTVSGTIVEHC